MKSRAAYVKFLREMERVDPKKKWLDRFISQYEDARANDALDGGNRAALLIEEHWARADAIGQELMLERQIDLLTEAIRKLLPGEDL